MNGAARSIALPAVIDLDALEPLRDRLVDALDTGAVIVTGHAVERVSTNALLLLLSAAETAQHTARAFSLSAPSTAITTAIDRLGLGGRFAQFITG